MMEATDKKEEDQPLLNSGAESIVEEVSAEEKFPTKVIEHKNAVFVDYDPVSVKAKLETLADLDSTQRITYVKHLSIVLKELGDEGLQFLPKVFQTVMKDRDDLKRSLLSQVPELIVYVESVEKSTGYSKANIKDYIIPLLIKFLHMGQLDIKEEAGKYLGQIAQGLNDKDRGECVLKYVIEMAHDDANEDNRIVAVQLFSKMAGSFGRDLCDQFIGLEMLSLGEDSHLKVRKQAIVHLPTIAREVSVNFFKGRLLKFYQKKAGQTHWGIRKSCVDIIIDVAKLCDHFNEEALKQSQLQVIMLNFLRDTNKWVKISAYKQLGPFIASIKGRHISDKLIESYTKMATHEINDLGSDNELFHACAFNFPAVLDTLGAGKWEFLYPTYQRLLKITDKKIKKTLASSLHEVAKIVGETYTRNHLFNILDSFLKDTNDQIKLGAIQHLSDTIQVLDAQKRQELIDLFLMLQKDQKKWRIRECIAQQLNTLSQIYDAQTVFTYIVPIAFKFCTDTVSIVREEASQRIGAIVAQFHKKPGAQHFLLGIIQNIKGFANSPKYTQRQAFVGMCPGLLEFQDLFESNFLNSLDELSRDKIINVKIGLARVLRDYARKEGALCKNQAFIKIVNSLKQDKDEEIRQIFEQE